MNRLQYVLITLVLCIIGFIIYKPFFEFSMEMIKNNKVQLFSNSITSQFRSQIVFTIIIGCIPTLYFIIQKITKIKFLFDGFYVLLFILIFGVLTSILRGVFISQQLMFLSNIELPDSINPSYSIDKFYFQYYLLLGFVIGGIISFFLLRLRSKIQHEI